MIEIRAIEVGFLHPNNWNPNKMDDEMLAKEVESIREFGFLDPLTVRAMYLANPDLMPNAPVGGWEIIDGEHRWIAAQKLGMRTVPCVVVEADDDTAKQMTVVLNDLRGKPKEEKLAALVRDLSERRSMLDLERVLPYRRERLEEMIAERRADFDWDALRRPRGAPDPDAGPRWVERVYRFPADAAQVVDDAIARVKDDSGVEDWKALELICADYIAGA